MAKELAKWMEQLCIHEEKNRIRKCGLPYILGKSPAFSNVFQICWDTINTFQGNIEDCMVAVKADGIRCLIHCDLESNCVALTSSWDIIRQRWNWNQRPLGKVQVHCGFSLYSEMVKVSNSTVYLVYDIVHWQIEPHDEVSSRSSLEMFESLNIFVKELQLPGVICKPQISITANWESLLLGNYPYSTDGLIFTRPFTKNRIETWKWKPTDKITIDFMLWNSIVHNERLQFDLYVSRSDKCGLWNSFETDDDIDVARNDHVRFSLAGFDSCISLGIENVPLFTRGIIVELRWSSESSQWDLIRFRTDKSAANTLPVVIQLLNLVTTPLSIEHVISSVPKSYYNSRLSAFKSLRQYHQSIKRVIYSTFGATSNLNLCCRKLTDLPIYTTIGLGQILAVDIDGEPLAVAQSHLQYHSSLSEKDTSCNISLALCDLSIRDSLKEVAALDETNSFGAVFCNFAVHYFFASEECTSAFLSNVVPFLADNGSFVVLFMDGNEARKKMPLIIKAGSYPNNETAQGQMDGESIEFSLSLCENCVDSVNVYIKSIGKNHIESIVEKEELIRRFSKEDLECTSILTFPELECLTAGTDMCSHINLSSDERLISNLYRCAIFRKVSSTEPRLNSRSSQLFLRLPSLLLVGDILPYLGIKEIRVFAATCLEAHRLGERVCLVENREAYIQPFVGTLSQYGTFPIRGIGYIMQVLGFSNSASFFLFVSQNDRDVPCNYDSESDSNSSDNDYDWYANEISRNSDTEYQGGYGYGGLSRCS